QVAHTNGKENQRAVHKVISTAAMLFSLIALTLLVGIAGLYALGVPTRLVGAAPAEESAEITGGLAVFMVCFALSIPLSCAKGPDGVPGGLQGQFMGCGRGCDGTPRNLAGDQIARRDAHAGSGLRGRSGRRRSSQLACLFRG